MCSRVLLEWSCHCPACPGLCALPGGVRLECPSRCSCLGKQRPWLSYCLCPQPCSPRVPPGMVRTVWFSGMSCPVPQRAHSLAGHPGESLRGFAHSQYSGCLPQSFQRVELLPVPVLGVLSPCIGAQSCESGCSSRWEMLGEESAQLRGLGKQEGWNCVWNCSLAIEQMQSGPSSTNRSGEQTPKDPSFTPISSGLICWAYLGKSFVE